MDEKRLLETALSHPLLRTIDVDILRLAVRSSHVVTYRPNRTFLREGDPPEQVFFLLAGAVRVYHRANGGSELLLKLFGAPALFGEMEVMANRPFVEYVTTLDHSEILHVPRKVFLKLLSDAPEFARAVAFDLAFRLCIAAHNLKAVAFCDVDTRLANLLIDYVQMVGEPQDGGIRIPVALSQVAMARDLAASRNAVAVALRKLRKRAVLTKSRGRYLIRDLEALRAQGSGLLSLSFRSDKPIQSR